KRCPRAVRLSGISRLIAASLRLSQQLRQLGDVGRDPPRLIELRGCAYAGCTQGAALQTAKPPDAKGRHVAKPKPPAMTCNAEQPSSGPCACGPEKIVCQKDQFCHSMGQAVGARSVCSY